MSFGNAYQGGSHVDVLVSQGKDPLGAWKLVPPKSGAVKVFDKSVKGYVFACEGVPNSKMLLPKDDRKVNLSLFQRYFCLQALIPPASPFTMELSVADSSGSKRRVVFSSASKEVVATPLHARVPLTVLKRGIWMNYVFDLYDIVDGVFKGMSLRSVDSISITPSIRIRRIFTLKQCPMDTTDDADIYGEDMTSGPYDVLPKAVAYPPTVEHYTQVINMWKISAAEEMVMASRGGKDRSGKARAHSAPGHQVDGGKNGVGVGAAGFSQYRPPGVVGGGGGGVIGTGRAQTASGQPGARLFSATKPSDQGPTKLAFGRRIPVRDAPQQVKTARASYGVRQQSRGGMGSAAGSGFGVGVRGGGSSVTNLGRYEADRNIPADLHPLRQSQQHGSAGSGGTGADFGVNGANGGTRRYPQSAHASRRPLGSQSSPSQQRHHVAFEQSGEEVEGVDSIDVDDFETAHTPGRVTFAPPPRNGRASAGRYGSSNTSTAAAAAAGTGGGGGGGGSGLGATGSMSARTHDGTFFPDSPEPDSVRNGGMVRESRTAPSTDTLAEADGILRRREGGSGNGSGNVPRKRTDAEIAAAKEQLAYRRQKLKELEANLERELGELGLTEFDGAAPDNNGTLAGTGTSTSSQGAGPIAPSRSVSLLDGDHHPDTIAGEDSLGGVGMVGEDSLGDLQSPSSQHGGHQSTDDGSQQHQHQHQHHHHRHQHDDNVTGRDDEDDDDDVLTHEMLYMSQGKKSTGLLGETLEDDDLDDVVIEEEAMPLGGDDTLGNTQGSLVAQAVREVNAAEQSRNRSVLRREEREEESARLNMTNDSLEGRSSGPGAGTGTSTGAGQSASSSSRRHSGISPLSDLGRRAGGVADDDSLNVSSASRDARLQRDSLDQDDEEGEESIQLSSRGHGQDGGRGELTARRLQLQQASTGARPFTPPINLTGSAPKREVAISQSSPLSLAKGSFSPHSSPNSDARIVKTFSSSGVGNSPLPSSAHSTMTSTGGSSLARSSAHTTTTTTTTTAATTPKATATGPHATSTDLEGTGGSQQVRSDGKQDDDLELMYDPVLNCYFDPKTNTYYELKS